MNITLSDLARLRRMIPLGQGIKLKDVKFVYLFYHGYEKQHRQALIVTREDQVFGIGSNRDGILGIGHSAPLKSPQLIPNLCDKGIIAFASGFYHVLALSKDGQVWSWGKNNY